jgi:hypothetical protein
MFSFYCCTQRWTFRMVGPFLSLFLGYIPFLAYTAKGTAIFHFACLLSEAMGRRQCTTQKHLLYLKQHMCSRFNRHFELQ